MKTYVFAGNRRHFEVWCRLNNIDPRNPTFVYVAHPIQLAGLTLDDAKFEYYETWREHPNWPAYYVAMRAIESIGRTKGETSGPTS